MSQVDRAAVDLPTQAVNLHNRLREFQPALEQRVGELALAGATPDEQLELGVMREHMQAVSELAQAAVAAITEADIPLRDAPEEILASAPLRNMVRDYANQRGGGFTIRDLKDYLSDLGVEVPTDNRAFQRQFASWQDEIVTERAAAGERRCWVKLNPRTYALAWLGTPAAVTPEATAPADAPPARRPRRTARVAEPAPLLPARATEVTSEAASELALQLVAESPDDHGGLLVERLAAQSGGDISSAWLVFNKLIDTGRLTQEKAGEAVFFRPVLSASTEQNVVRGEDPVAAAALRIVTDAPGEPAKNLIGRLVGEQNMSTPTAREVFERLAADGRIYRYNSEGRVRYGLEPPTEPVRRQAAKATESVPEVPDGQQVQLAQQVLEAFIGRGLSFGTALTPQEIARKLSEADDGSSVTVDEVKAAANYLWSLGFVTRIEAQGRLKLQLADRSIMTSLKGEKGRADVREHLARGLSFAPPVKLRKRPPTKKKR